MLRIYRLRVVMRRQLVTITMVLLCVFVQLFYLYSGWDYRWTFFTALIARCSFLILLIYLPILPLLLLRAKRKKKGIPVYFAVLTVLLVSYINGPAYILGYWLYGRELCAEKIFDKLADCMHTKKKTELDHVKRCSFLDTFARPAYGATQVGVIIQENGWQVDYLHKSHLGPSRGISFFSNRQPSECLKSGMLLIWEHRISDNIEIWLVRDDVVYPSNQRGAFFDWLSL